MIDFVIPLPDSSMYRIHTTKATETWYDSDNNVIYRKDERKKSGTHILNSWINGRLKKSVNLETGAIVEENVYVNNKLVRRYTDNWVTDYDDQERDIYTKSQTSNYWSKTTYYSFGSKVESNDGTVDYYNLEGDDNLTEAQIRIGLALEANVDIIYLNGRAYKITEI